MLKNYFRWLLFPIAVIYGLVTSLRNLLYDLNILKTIEIPVPVIAVGNITAGGTGKTPFVIALSEFLLGHGFRVAVIARGYRRQSRGQVIVSDSRQVLTQAYRAGDEPYLIARKLPQGVVIANADRIIAARTALEKYNCDVIVADDAFQHRRLARDLNILLWDPHMPSRECSLLPVGRLRESLRGLRRADYLIFTKTDEIDEKKVASFKKYNPRLTCFSAPLIITRLETLSGEKISPATLSGKNVLAFSGLGNPAQFEATIRKLAPARIAFHRFPDHHKYTTTELYQLISAAQSNDCDYLLTTEKDAVNFPESGAFPVKILILIIELKLDEKLKAAVLQNVPPRSNFRV